LEEYYSISNAAVNCSWSVTNGSILQYQNSNQISVLWESTSGKITVTYNNEYGCPSVSELSVTPVQLFGGGTGRLNNPYLIKTSQQLSTVRGFPESHYALVNDIDLSDFLENTTAGWEPIQEFSGSFDGRFFKIKGLWINQPNSSNLGLFARNRGTIEKLYLEIDSKGIYGNDNIGDNTDFYHIRLYQ
jgi:hypothetical protein